ncbi:MAG: hypothetical protein VW450_05210 [Chloroflexota bacterium]
MAYDEELACRVRALLATETGTDEEALARPGVRPMDFTGKPIQGFVYMAAEALRDDAALAGWVRQGLAGAASAPAKKARKPRTPGRVA